MVSSPRGLLCVGVEISITASRLCTSTVDVSQESKASSPMVLRLAVESIDMERLPSFEERILDLLETERIEWDT